MHSAWKLYEGWKHLDDAGAWNFIRRAPAVGRYSCFISLVKPDSNPLFVWESETSLVFVGMLGVLYRCGSVTFVIMYPCLRIVKRTQLTSRKKYMNTVSVVLKCACECMKMVNPGWEYFSFRTFCAEGESKELHSMTLSH